MEAILTALSMFIVTFNIRLATPKDLATGDGWSTRRKVEVIALVRELKADVYGFQEVLPEQNADLAAGLPEYGWVGKPREDGETKGEMSPIYYRKERFDLVRTETRWLSRTPDRPGKDWDAAIVRIATMARLRDKATGREVDVWNTHFDHVGEIARLESAKLLDRWGRESGAVPVVLMGDLNCRPGSAPVAHLEQSGHWTHARKSAGAAVAGPSYTFGGFDEGKEPEVGEIDHIFLGLGWKARGLEVVVRVKGGKYPSDHFPVGSRIDLLP
jgi:endonuclease/exonuclease/phosphatase family metal-dependent hydrolase